MGKTGSPVLFFPKTNKNLDASFRYIDYVNTVEGITLTEYGIEGQTWNRNEQGQPRLVQSLLDRKAAGDNTWQDDLLDTGALYISGSLKYGSLNMEWFGEASAGEADSAVQEIEDYKKLKPVMRLPGYPLYALQTDFPEWDKINDIFSSDLNVTYTQRAYFAPTEAEARSILLEYQNYVRTTQNGIFMDFMKFLDEQLKSRPDIAL